MQSLIYISMLFVFMKNASSYFVTIDAHAEECYFEKVNTGTKLSLMFEVAEGGFLDIDVKVCLGYTDHYLLYIIKVDREL